MKTRFGGFFICEYFYKNNAHTQHKTKSITDNKGA